MFRKTGPQNKYKHQNSKENCNWFISNHTILKNMKISTVKSNIYDKHIKFHSLTLSSSLLLGLPG